MGKRRYLGAAVTAVVVADLLLLLSGYRIPVSEKGRPAGGEGIFYTEYLCTYFTGRSLKHELFTSAYTDECPVIVRPH